MENENKPLSQRYDLTYVRRPSRTQRVIRWSSLGLAIGFSLYVVVSVWIGDQRAFSSGPLSQPHAMFANDCAQCHQPDPNSAGYFTPVQDDACLKCHVAQSHHGLDAAHPGMRVSDRLGRLDMSMDCASCHTEHRGPDFDISRVPDSACVACHGQLDQVRHELQAGAPASAESEVTQ